MYPRNTRTPIDLSRPVHQADLERVRSEIKLAITDLETRLLMIATWAFGVVSWIIVLVAALRR